MSAAVLDLFAAHDVLTPEEDASAVKRYLKTLESFHCLGDCSVKDLQELTSGINVCLSSAKGKLNGLLALETLMKQCSAEYFHSNGGSFISVLVNQVLSKPSHLQPASAALSCDVLTHILRTAPAFPDVSKQLHSLVPSLVSCLVETGDQFPSGLGNVLDCFLALFNAYPGTSGNSSAQIEKFILKQISPSRCSCVEKLAKCYSCLAHIGGCGKEGINHKTSWTRRFEECVATLNQLFQILISKSAEFNSAAKVISFPSVSSSNQLKNAYDVSFQFLVVSRFTSALLRTAFPYGKKFRPFLLVDLSKKVLEVKFSSQVASPSHDSKVLLTVLPEIYTSTLSLLADFVRVCGLDLLPFEKFFYDFILTTLEDARQVSGIGEHQTAIFARVKVWAYRLVTEMNEAFGSTFSNHPKAGEIVSVVVSDFLPASDTVKLLTEGKKATKRKHGSLRNVLEKTTKRMRSGDWSVTEASLQALAAIFKSSGCFLNMDVHKNVQCAIISTCLELQQHLSGNPRNVPFPYESPQVRSALYSALLSLVTGSHPKWPAPVTYAIRIFEDGKVNDNDRNVRDVCSRGSAHCQSITHPRSQTLSLELPMSREEIDNVKKQLMKVHTIVLESCSENSDMFKRKEVEADGIFEPETGKLPEPTVTVPNGTPEVRSKLPDNGGCKLPLRTSPLLSLKKPVEKQGSQETITEEMDAEESRELMRSYYNFENEPIVIPEDIGSAPSAAKKQGESSEEAEASANAEGEEVDVNVMLGSFVDKLRGDE